MNRVVPAIAVGNDFVLPARRLQPVIPAATIHNEVNLPEVNLSLPDPVENEPGPPPAPEPAPNHFHVDFSKALDLLHRHSLVSFAFLILMVGATGIQVAGSYGSARIAASTPNIAKPAPKAIAGLNSTVPTAELANRVQSITNQPASLDLGTKVLPISPATIKSWLQITPSKDGSQQYIHVKAAAISESLTKLANSQVKAPVNQVTVTRDGVSKVIANGRNGSTLTDPASLGIQANQIAKTVMDGKGLKFSTPLVVQPFQSVTPANFSKMIEVDIVTKQLYAYQNGELVRSFPISAGAPETPTPIGQYKIYSKLAQQDMRGFNADGTKYFQPKVKYVSYFLSGGYAIHGNYWRPMSWFGSINSSHGCVSLPDSNGSSKWIYDFAPIGTTVITHT